MVTPRPDGQPHAFVYRCAGDGRWQWVLRLAGRGAVAGGVWRGYDSQPAAFAAATAAVDEARTRLGWR